MRDKARLENLNVSELNILRGHVQLGVDHLHKHLNNDQLSELLNYGSISSLQYQKIKTDGIEEHGNIILMFNTVFTCVLGGWLASITFIGISPAANRYVLFSILATAAVSSGYFGYVSFKKVRVEAKKALTTQKLANLQIKILSLIEEKMQHSIDKVVVYLNDVFDNFSCEKTANIGMGSFNSFQSKEEFVKWLNELNIRINAELMPLSEKTIYDVFIKGIRKIKLKLEKAIDTNVGLVEDIEATEQIPDNSRKSAQFSLEHNKHTSFITILTDPEIVIPKAEIKKKSWLKSNIYSIVNGLIPTILGSFCSLFTYFNGLPDIAKKFGLQFLVPSLENPITQSVTFFIIFAITLYFGYVFVHGNRRSFQREQELEKTQKQIANKETGLLAINSRLNLLMKVKENSEDILLILSFIRHISKSIENIAPTH
jgi:hypothetical protein